MTKEEKLQKAVEEVRTLLNSYSYSFDEKVDLGKYKFSLRGDDGQGKPNGWICIYIWVSKENIDPYYHLTIEEVSENCKHSILLSIGQTYVSVHGYQIGQVKAISLEGMKTKIKDILKSHPCRKNGCPQP